MECDRVDDGGYTVATSSRLARRFTGVHTGGVRDMRLQYASPTFRVTSPGQLLLETSPTFGRPAINDYSPEFPFMNNMDEISYWIITKRPPCLMDYDNLNRRQNSEAHCSKTKSSINDELPLLMKKKKRKLSILNDEHGSVLSEKQNIYFEVRQKHNKHVINSCKSGSLGSNVNFNINNTPLQQKCKQSKLQKKFRPTLHKNNKMVTSTPRAMANLRRSVRQAQQQSHNNSHLLNSSFEMFNLSVVNGSNLKNERFVPLEKKAEMLAGGDQTNDSKEVILNRSKNLTAPKGQFEDLSDVSGFTANYIRSTKVQSGKSPRKMRCKPSRNLVKVSRQNGRKESTTVCVNKSINTGLPNTPQLNSSTDSSQNVLNLVTSKSNDKSIKVNRSTSLLKFMETRARSKESVNNGPLKKNLNISFPTRSSTSRYPKRCKNISSEAAAFRDHVVANRCTSDKRRSGKTLNDFTNSDRKENPEEISVSRTRSGKSILRKQEISVLVLSNSPEQVSSLVSINVATPETLDDKRKKQTSAKQLLPRKGDKRQSLKQNSLRDKSGFAACFSDSEDSEPVRQRKFFCT